jgi:hypothetical protein
VVVGGAAKGDANVLKLGFDLVEGGLVSRPLELGPAREDVVGVVVGVTGAVERVGGGGRQVGLAELAHRLQQGIASRATRFVGHDEGLGNQRQDPFEHLPLLDALARNDGLGRVNRERPGEDRAAVKDRALGLVQ